MKEILEVITALNQAANNAMWKKTDALEREKFKGPRDFKVNDSFKLKFADNKMMVEYTLEVKNALMPNIKFEVNPDNKITSILKYLKDEYKQITGKSISFEEESKLNIVVTPISNVTQINRYSKSFTIKDTESYKDSYNKEVEKHHKEQIKKIDTLEEQLNKKVLKEGQINEIFGFGKKQQYDDVGNEPQQYRNDSQQNHDDRRLAWHRLTEKNKNLSLIRSELISQRYVALITSDKIVHLFEYTPNRQFNDHNGKPITVEASDPRNFRLIGSSDSKKEIIKQYKQLKNNNKNILQIDPNKLKNVNEAFIAPAHGPQNCGKK